MGNRFLAGAFCPNLRGSQMIIDARQHLIQAMCHLTFGDSGKFCDHLWLAYGDSWRPVLADLVSRHLVTVRINGDEEVIEITPRGRAWTQQMGTLATSAA